MQDHPPYTAIQCTDTLCPAPSGASSHPLYTCPSPQLTSPVQWETTLKTLLGRGLERSYEVGPGKVIAGIMKRIDKKADITNVIA